MLNIVKCHTAPVSVTAAQFTEDNGVELARWCDSVYIYVSHGNDPASEFVDLKLVDGDSHRAVLGDWIVKGTDGSFKVYTHDEFPSFYAVSE